VESGDTKIDVEYVLQQNARVWPTESRLVYPIFVRDIGTKNGASFVKQTKDEINGVANRGAQAKRASQILWPPGERLVYCLLYLITVAENNRWQHCV
jgi:hypothetical protein